MSEISAYEAQVKKMQGLCEEHNLVYRFHKERYPMTFTIKPSCTMDAQISMLESVEDEGYISPAASMTWIFNDGVLETKVRGGTFTISKTTRTKIENILIKMITFWQQYFFRCVIENGSLSKEKMPTISDEELWPEGSCAAEAPRIFRFRLPSLPGCLMWWTVLTPMPGFRNISPMWTRRRRKAERSGLSLWDGIRECSR